MSRTAAGYVFKCKECGETHLMYDGEPHDGIRVPCAWDEGKVKEYDEKDDYIGNEFGLRSDAAGESVDGAGGARHRLQSE